MAKDPSHHSADPIVEEVIYDLTHLAQQVARNYKELKERIIEIELKLDIKPKY